MSIKEPDFTKLQISDEFGRASFFNHPFLVYSFLGTKHKQWPVPFGLIMQTHQHQWKFYIIYKDNKDFDEYLEKYLQNPELFTELETYTNKMVSSVESSLKGMDFSTCSNNHLKEYLLEYYQSFTNMFSVAWVLRSMDRAIIARLQTYFPKSEDFNKVFSVISISDKISFAAEKNRALMHIALQLKNKNPDRTMIKAEVFPIYEKYKHATLGYFTEPIESLSKYIEQTEEYLKEDIQSILKAQQRKEHDDITKREEVLAQYSLSKEQHLVLTAGAQSAWYKDFYKFNVNKIILWSLPLFEEIAKRGKTTSDIVKDMTIDEVTALIAGKSVDFDLIKKRTEHAILVAYGEYRKVFVGDQAQKFETTHLKRTNELSTFKGRCACMGKVSGIVKVVRSPNDFHKINKGDIIVVTNTSPDFVPILSKVKAILAEEGGITAHASVISRELNIPCVVAIRDITKSLKDNDIVEVDATQGVVKKL